MTYLTPFEVFKKFKEHVGHDIAVDHTLIGEGLSQISIFKITSVININSHSQLQKLGCGSSVATLRDSYGKWREISLDDIADTYYSVNSISRVHSQINHNDKHEENIKSTQSVSDITKGMF